jgi:tetratricopeptide (TPR) repeat protein
LVTAGDKNEIEAAIELIADAVRQDPLFVGAQIALGRASLRMFEASNNYQWLERGLEHAQRASGLGGRADEAWRVMAALHHAAGRPEAALAALRTAVRLQPENAEAYFDLGTIHQELKHFDESEKAFESSLYLRPGYWPGHDALAKLYLVQGLYEPAAIQFRHVVDCAPDLAIAYVKLAGTNIYLGRTKTATELLEKSIDIEPSSLAYSNLGLLYFDGSRFADAAAMYELALEEDPDSYVLWGFLAYSLLYADQADRAEETFRRAVELAEEELAHAPEDLWVRTDLADYYAMLGEHTRGIELLDTVAEANPEDPQLVGWIAEVYEDLDEREKALEWVGKSLDAGLSPSRFEGRPTLRDLAADERFRALVDLHTGGP